MSTSSAGYFRFPTVHGDRVVFVSEDDLWAVPLAGGTALRLTASAGALSHPVFSPDGRRLAVTGRDEGHPEAYVMDASGGPLRRVTHLGVTTHTVGWHPSGERLLIASDFGSGIDRIQWIHAVDPAGGLPERLPFGPAVAIAFGPGGRIVLGRNQDDIAHWKRYRGGTAGRLWIGEEGGEFRPLVELDGNLARPMWLGERVYFLSDHEGVGNLYSVRPDGTDLRRHTDQTEFYVRHPATDGETIVFVSGGDLFRWRAGEGAARIEVDYPGPRTARKRKFVDPSKYLESYDPDPRGKRLAVTTRGKAFVFGPWEGPVRQQNPDPNAPIRTRLSRWLPEGDRVATITDHFGQDVLEIHEAQGEGEVRRFEGLDLGRVAAMEVSPDGRRIALGNHRNQLLVVELESGAAHEVARSPAAAITEFAWSPDGAWLAFSFAENSYRTALRLWRAEDGSVHPVCEPILHDRAPAWDPDGRYLYFIGVRELKPVYDQLHFDLGFPHGSRPYLVTLAADTPHPFRTRPDQPSDKGEAGAKEGASGSAAASPEGSGPGTKAEEGAPSAEGGPSRPAPRPPVKIDLEGLGDRVVAFPVSEEIYTRIDGLPGTALFVSQRAESVLELELGAEPKPRGTLQAYSFADQETTVLASGISDFRLSLDRKTMVLRAGQRLRVLPAGKKAEDGPGNAQPGRKSGWVDLGRVKVLVEPAVEWRQMMREAWLLQREFFWTPDMSAVDWERVWNRYESLLERVNTRGELSDLIKEMQGELGTSHAYEFGGDYPQPPPYRIGQLGADFELDEGPGYRIARILRGAPGDARASSPLLGPGVEVREGDRLLAVDGVPVDRNRTPHEALLFKAKAEVTLTVQRGDEPPRRVVVETLPDEAALRYREWVEANKRTVHERTDGRVGYIHIPDMGPRGYAEFHRHFLTEVARDGLIVDVRFNRGGHVSGLLLEKLARRRVGFDLPRWGELQPYPAYSPAGPMVAITNEYAGSDGDIFSHTFKLMGLGPLIGKRTWGGVIGIWPRNALADGTITSQPEFSFWFVDVGWGVENYGTDPDVEVEFAPHDYARGNDPQLEKALELIMEEMEKKPPLRPDFGDRPRLPLPEAL